MNTDNSNEMFTFLYNHICKSRDMSRVDALPLPCGCGKSTFISHYIYDCIRAKRGLIVVTDSLDRLSDYSNRLSDFLQRNRQYVAFLTADNYRDEIATVRYKHIVAMTTQRYFSLTREEILGLTSYQYGKRETVLFDEQPYFTELITINIDVLDGVDAVLHQAIDNRDNQKDKQWLITQWENVCKYLKVRISEYESCNKAYEYNVFHFDPSNNAIDDPERFTELIRKYKIKLRSFNYKFDAYKYIAAVMQLLSDGASFTSKKLSRQKKDGTEYSNYFLVLIDNREKLIDIGAKVFVLDATADISPEYDVSYINMVDCRAFQPKLNNLTINIVDVHTGKGYLARKGSEVEQIIDCLISYQDGLPTRDQVLFTYKYIQDRYAEKLLAVYEHIDHFGNIKGKNDYRECTNIIQFGLNRYPQSFYDLHCYFSILDRYKERCTCYFGRDCSRQTVINSILADIEQNIFRSKIRNSDCKEKVTYTIMFDKSGYEDLITAMQVRYGPTGARVNVFGAPLEFEKLKTEKRQANKMTSAQKVINWFYAMPQDTRATRKDIMQSCGITESQFKDAKRNAAVKLILKTMATDTPGLYIKH